MRAAIAGLVIALLVTSCSSTAPIDEADPEGTITTTLFSDPFLDPQLSSSANAVGTIRAVFEPLFRFDPKTLRPLPAAAKALPEVSADGLTYRITVRDDARFSDGSPVRAADFGFGIERLCDPALKASNASAAYPIVGCAEWGRLDPSKDPAERLEAARGRLTSVGLRVTSEKDLTLTLSAPVPDFTSTLAGAAWVPVRRSDVARGGQDWTEPATYIGNGPFVLSEWKRGGRVVLTPNRFYREPPRLKKWIKLVITEPAVVLNAYRHDELDGYFASGAASQGGASAGAFYGEIVSDPALAKDVALIGNLCSNGFGFNTRRPPFDDPNVRLAFAKALDREAYVRDVLGGVGAPGVSAIPPGAAAHDRGDVVQSFDVSEARRLLAASRYTSGTAFPPVVIEYVFGGPRGTRTEWVSQQWKRNLGVDVRPKEIDAPTQGQLFRKPETIPQAFFIGYCLEYDDASLFFNDFLHPDLQGTLSGMTGFSDPRVLGMIGKAEGERDLAQRNDLFRGASRILSQAAPIAIINWGRSLSLRKPWIRGVMDSPLDFEIGMTAGMEKIYVAKGRR